jgi:glycosyltransferase involved in cell wall biosynthesis
MEALARGRPVITTAIAGIPELVRENEEGWLVPSGDPIALADAMRSALAAAPEDLAAMGASGRARVQTQHDALHEAEHLASCVRQAIERGSD